MKLPLCIVTLLLLAGFQLHGNLNGAIELYGRGRFQQAAEQLRRLRDASPSDPEIRIRLGKACIKIREWDKAVQEMEKAVQLQPANAKYHLWLGRACGMRASHSSFLTAMGWARRVLREFETARKLSPADLDVRFDLLEYYLNAPGILGGGRQKAEAEAEAIARLDATKGRTARAAILIKNKEYDSARKELTQATLDNPRSVSANKDLADFLLERNDFAGALNYAKKTLDLDSDSKRARLIAAAARVRLQSDLKDAVATLQDLSNGILDDGAPSFEEVYYWLGECYLALGDNSKARSAFKSALAFDPDYGRAQNGIAKAAPRAGKPDI
jgi:predicted Zn-dependent protease